MFTNKWFSHELQGESAVSNMLTVWRPTNNWSQNQGWIEEDGLSTECQIPGMPQPPVSTLARHHSQHGSEEQTKYWKLYLQNCKNLHTQEWWFEDQVVICSRVDWPHWVVFQSVLTVSAWSVIITSVKKTLSGHCLSCSHLSQSRRLVRWAR